MNDRSGSGAEIHLTSADSHQSNIVAGQLDKVRSNFTAENLAILDRFFGARNSSLISRLPGLKQSGIYRQMMMCKLGLIAAAVFRKV